MIVDEKPPLDENLLMHFGIKGMKWGHRKARDSGGASSGGSSAPKQGMSTKKKVAIGVGVGAAVVGAAAASYFLVRRGKSPMSALTKVAKAAENRPKAGNPSPAEMMRQLEGHKQLHFETRSYLAGKQAVLQSNGRYKLIPSHEAQQLTDAFGKRSRFAALRGRKFTPSSAPVISRAAPKAPVATYSLAGGRKNVSANGRTYSLANGQKAVSQLDSVTQNLLNRNAEMLRR